MAVRVANKSADTSVLVANREINLSAREADLEPGRIFLAYTQLSHFIRKRELGSEGRRVEGSFLFGRSRFLLLGDRGIVSSPGRGQESGRVLYVQPGSVY